MLVKLHRQESVARLGEAWPHLVRGAGETPHRPAPRVWCGVINYPCRNKNNMALKNLFKPTKEKLVIDLLLSVFLIILILAVPSFGLQKQFLSTGLLRQIIGLIISFLLSLIIYYPLACGLVCIYKRIFNKTEKSNNKVLILAILSVLIFNPITYSLLFQAIISFNNKALNQPCGVEITGFAQKSPAKEAGIGLGEIIVAADGQKVIDLNSFFSAVSGRKPGDYISLITNNKEYRIQTIGNPNNPQAAYLGILINTKYCNK